MLSDSFIFIPIIQIFSKTNTVQHICYPLKSNGRFNPLDRNTYLKTLIGQAYINLDYETMGSEHSYEK